VKSTEGKHFVGLDQIRGFAAFLVFVWHFRNSGMVPGTQLPGTFDFFGNSLLAEGHTGVGIFMVLSGYLFVKLTEGRQLLFRPFLFNRFMRLAPLMGLVLAIRLVLAAFEGLTPFEQQLMATLKGFVLPTWPNGGWSITIEAQFYLIFPILLLILRKRTRWLIAVLVAALLIRTGVYELFGVKVVRLAYQTIFGRIDQFVIGMLLGQLGGFMRGRHFEAGVTSVTFLLLWAMFARYGGFYGTQEVQKAWIWIWIPLAEAVAYGLLIAYYDTTFRPPRTGVSGLLGKIGEWSFSIYLLHRFLVAPMKSFLVAQGIAFDSFYEMLLYSLPCFALTCLVSWITYEQFEKRFLKRRRPYLAGQQREAVPPEPLAATAP